MRTHSFLALVLLGACGGLSATSEDVLFPNDGNATGDDDDVLGDDDDDVQPTDGDADTDADADADADADTDADTDADADADTDADTDTDTDVDSADTGTPPTTTPPPCSAIPNTGINTQGQQPGTFSPDGVAVSVFTSAENGNPADYKYYDTTASSWFDESATVIFEYYIAGSYQCAVIYDFSQVATHTGNNGWAAGMYEAWNLDLNASSPWTDCPELGSTFVPTNPAAWLEQYDWGIAFGPLSTDVGTAMQSTISANPAKYGDWATDYEPYLFGLYISLDGGAASDYGFVYEHERDCAEVTDSTGFLAPPNPKPTGGPMTEYYRAIAWYLLGIS